MSSLKMFLILFSLTALFFSCTSKTEKNSISTSQQTDNKIMSVAGTNQKYQIVSSEKVCMVNDRYMGIKQIPIETSGIIYYGCCQNCVKKIQENLDGVRYSKDPITGKSVDKASAIIVRNTEDGMVQYFESETSAQSFIKR